MNPASTTNPTIFTIGHSNHPQGAFVDLLVRHGITALVDVRSSPYSRFNPQFNRRNLATALNRSDIRYIFLGHELGGRSDDEACYEQGRIRYERVAQTDHFRSGMDRLAKGVTTHRIALMCAEKEPLNCHRTLLVAHALDGRGIKVQHILADGSLELHRETMNRLLTQCGMSQEGDLLANREEAIAAAIVRQAGRVAHMRPQNKTQPELKAQ